ncbi:hypothetical protein QEG60_003407 [Pluralibacter gergoviae]|mgnify:FL=1|uniref:hypothetical protein n=1 Tax=Pluralibacter gergoviae TaxID=61647 RepID=UPI000A3A7131|nr:hypothetical protein [Pluralibacter gergoviae]EKV3544688.1 hypothetical protein [Pluralibacter gergoviae]EKV9900315.1 hypothetical protein [Pluralibacter gergoviae]EKV9930846.1 hypothetical protein [Pluralibacter gergoviae]OUF43704.1 hypothetical protein AZ034_004369 [Pluralibacter gergoviae]OUF55465.1 hypothetical protein AZ044_001715 [Pluralibacter gergoviae]
MQIDYQDSGAIARITIRSSVLAMRKHRRAVDAALLCSTVTARTSGLVILRTEITGKTPAVMRAYKAITQEAARWA